MRFNILLLLWITFLDILALSIFFGTSIPLILAPNSILLGAISQHDLIYGFTLVILPIGQFFIGPIWGQLADQYGRKRILMITLLCSMIGFFVMALAIDEKLFWLFILGRSFSAIIAINGALAQASMADLSQGIQKTKRFNWQFIMVSFGFIAGPYFIQVTTHNIHFSHVYWGIALFYAITGLLIYAAFTETLTTVSKQKIRWAKNFEHIFNLLQEKQLRKILLVWCVFQIGWSLFFQFSGEFLYSARHLPNEAINQLFSWVGAGILLTQILLVQPVAKKTLPVKIVPWAIVAVGLSLLCGGLLPMGIGFYIALAFYCIGIAFFLTNFNTYISNLATNNQQGRIMTLLTAGQAGMTILVTLFGNYVATKYLATPYVIGGALILMSTLFWLKSRH
jgi:MFS family permease